VRLALSHSAALTRKFGFWLISETGHAVDQVPGLRQHHQPKSGRLPELRPSDTGIPARQPAARQRTSVVTWIVTGLVALGGFGSLVGKCAADKDQEVKAAAEQERVAKLTPEQLAAETKERAAAAAKEAEQEKRSEENYARAATGAKILKSSMRNPDSFKLSEVLVMSDGSVCYEYRAQNGFGGINVEHAVFWAVIFQAIKSVGVPSGLE
jgi:hypothetical protein